jgi:hypothetical protein
LIWSDRGARGSDGVGQTQNCIGSRKLIAAAGERAGRPEILDADFHFRKNEKHANVSARPFTVPDLASGARQRLLGTLERSKKFGSDIFDLEAI